jgi:hypothetical protein
VTASAAATPDPPPAADVHPPAGPAIASYRIPSHTSVIEVLRRPVESAQASVVVTVAPRPTELLQRRQNLGIENAGSDLGLNPDRLDASGR